MSDTSHSTTQRSEAVEVTRPFNRKQRIPYKADDIIKVLTFILTDKPYNLSGIHTFVHDKMEKNAKLHHNRGKSNTSILTGFITVGTLEAWAKAYIYRLDF